MSLTQDQDKLFQSDAQHIRNAIRTAKAEALAERGQPITLASKPLQVVVREGKNGAEADAWVAESGFVVRRVGLESGKTRQLYKGHTGPVTSLAFYTTPEGREVVISGSWDKSFKIWDVATKELLSTTVGHIDFVKSVHVIPSLSLLLTGSSDKDLRLWDLSALSRPPSSSSSVPPTPVQPQEGCAPPPAQPFNALPCLLALKSHTRPIEVIASYPLYEPLAPGEVEEDVDVRDRKQTGRCGVVSADTMGAVKVWEVWRDGEGKVRGEMRCEVRDHEAGVWDVLISPEGEMWTASADSSLLLSRLSLTSCTLSTPPTPLLRLPHPSQIRTFLPLSLSPSLLPFPQLHSYLLTAGSDELLRAFSLSHEALDPSEKREKKRVWLGLPLSEGTLPEGCVNEVEAHTHEVVALCGYTVKGEEGGKREPRVLSASLDGTLRRWKVEELIEPGRFEKVVLVEVKEEERVSLLTEEEERELAELLGDD